MPSNNHLMITIATMLQMPKISKIGKKNETTHNMWTDFNESQPIYLKKNIRKRKAEEKNTNCATYCICELGGGTAMNDKPPT